jgi:hypothetical protein
MKYWVLIGFTVTALIMALILHFADWPMLFPVDPVIGPTVGLSIMALICFYFRLRYWFIVCAVAASIMTLIMLFLLLLNRYPPQIGSAAGNFVARLEDPIGAATEAAGGADPKVRVRLNGTFP